MKTNYRSTAQRMRSLLVAMSLLLLPVAVADAQMSIGIALPGISIGISVPVYPRLAYRRAAALGRTLGQ